MYKKTTFISMGCVLLVACGEDSTPPKIQCGPGTALNAASNTCEPRLTDNVVISDEGELVIKTERLDEVREVARRAGFDEGVASITPLQCTDNTELNAAGDSCKPTQAFRDEAFTAGRIDGISSVTPLNCADGTAVNADGNACEPTEDYRAAAVEEGRVAGVASVTPLVCDDGTLVNESDDACIPNLSVNVVVDADGLAVPSPEFGSRVCANAGGNFDVHFITETSRPKCVNIINANGAIQIIAQHGWNALGPKTLTDKRGGITVHSNTCADGRVICKNGAYCLNMYAMNEPNAPDPQGLGGPSM